MLNHLIAFLLGFILDQIIGDPYNIPHPIRLIGSFISFLDSKFMGPKDGAADDKKKARNSGREFKNGILMCALVLAATIIVTLFVTVAAYRIHIFLGIIVEAILTCYILAAKSLKVESMKVYYALRDKSLEEARYAVSMIVGRDTDKLDETGVSKAAVETVAENTSDGVIAPLIYTFFGGPILGMLYKAVNTMDSMVGYHNDRYEYFGKAADQVDDVFNFIPSRISALFMILAAFTLGKEFSGKRAYKIWKRDRFNHKSPNSAQTESTSAGALGIRLAGDASYFGKIVSKPYIGDDLRPVEIEDIKRVNKLMYVATYLCMAVLLIIGVALVMI